MIIAFGFGTLAFWFGNVTLVLVAAGLLVVGALVGLILKLAGFGVGGDRIQPKEHS